jgi:hypothetical protein
MRAWGITDGSAGMDSQVLALAVALGVDVAREAALAAWHTHATWYTRPPEEP